MSDIYIIYQLNVLVVSILLDQSKDVKHKAMSILTNVALTQYMYWHSWKCTLKQCNTQFLIVSIIKNKAFK